MPIRSVHTEQLELSTYVQAQLDSGESRQEIYDLLAPEFADVKSLAGLIAQTRSAQEWQATRKLRLYISALVIAWLIGNIYATWYHLTSTAQTYSLSKIWVGIALYTLLAAIDIVLLHRRRAGAWGGTISYLAIVTIFNFSRYEDRIFFIMIGAVLCVIGAYTYLNYRLRLGNFKKLSKDAAGRYIFT
jgi:hypothetical protein